MWHPVILQIIIHLLFGINPSPHHRTTGASATTTLSATITAAATSITVASGTNTATGGYVLIGTELMLVTAGGGTTTLTVIRGVLGTTAAAHTSGATVTFEDGCATQLSQAGLS